MSAVMEPATAYRVGPAYPGLFSPNNGGDDVWYVYAVLPALHAATPADGVVPGARVEALPLGPLTVLGSIVPRHVFDSADPDWMAERVAAHHRVVCAAGPCLPMAFGALFSGLDTLRNWLAPRLPILQAALRQAATQTEWALSIQQAAATPTAWLDAHDTAVCQPARSLASAAEGMAFLTGPRTIRARAAVRGRVIRGVRAVVTECAAEAGLSILPERARDGLPAWTVLVPHRMPDALERLLARLSGRLPPGLSPQHSGPWPAYAYARSALAEAAANV